MSDIILEVHYETGQHGTRIKRFNVEEAEAALEFSKEVKGAIYKVEEISYYDTRAVLEAIEKARAPEGHQAKGSEKKEGNYSNL
jgi:predicted hydrocarbon binding protein